MKGKVIVLLVFGTFTLLIYCSLYIYGYMMVQPVYKSVNVTYNNVRYAAEQNLSQKQSNIHEKRSRTFSTIIHDRLNEVMSEEEALSFQPCQDRNLATNPQKSKLILLDPSKTVYRITEKIYVLVTTFDSYGHKKTSGGDQIRATISSRYLNASAPGIVYDHKNGSYSIIFEALWYGTSVISATVAYRTETITALYRMMVKEECVRDILALYTFQKIEEEAVCHTDKNRLLTVLKYKDVCNFTEWISGMPWFCGKPRNTSLQCNNWKYVRNVNSEPPPTDSECDSWMLNGARIHMAIPDTVMVEIKGNKSGEERGNAKFYQPSVDCSKYDVTKLWFRKFTTGFFYNGTWKLRHCKEIQDSKLHECLRNKRLYLLGDSTVRHWYVDVMNRFDCIQYTEKWTNTKWKKPSGCKCAGNNMTVMFGTHSQPFYVGQNWTDMKFTLVTIPNQLETIKTDEEAVVLIHVFIHTITFHQKYFRIKMQAIRDSIEKLIQRNKKVKIFIKMPHTYTGSNLKGRVNDFFGYVFSQVIIQTFKGLHNSRRIIVLDNKDATLSINSEPNHPNTDIVRYMVNQMFSYLCE